MRKSTKIFITLVISVILLAQVTSMIFIEKFEKEFIEYRKDKQFIEQSIDLYALACTTPQGASEKECKELTNKVHIRYEKMNNDYKLVNFYVKYIAQ